MNKTFKLVKNIVAALAVLLLVIAVFIPAISVKSGDMRVDIFLIDLLNSSSLIGTIGDASVSTSIDIFSFALVGAFVITPLAVLIENKIVKGIGFGFAVASFSFSLSMLKTIALLRDQSGISFAGIIVFFIANIVTLLLIVVDFLAAFFGEKIMKLMAISNKSTEQLLKENDQLLKDGLITKEEAAARKEKILGAIK